MYLHEQRSDSPALRALEALIKNATKEAGHDATTGAHCQDPQYPARVHAIIRDNAQAFADALAACAKNPQLRHNHYVEGARALVERALTET